MFGDVGPEQWGAAATCPPDSKGAPQGLEPIHRGVEDRHLRGEGKGEVDGRKEPGPRNGMGEPGASPPRVGVKPTP